ncbi:hypothetical protein K2X89_08795 [Myxococcota bacterium]|nr:hypothetical protein [Myxococcota bacterium]
MKRRERSAPIWLFSFVDLAFLLLIAFTQLAPDPEQARAELAELELPRIEAVEPVANASPGAPRWQIRVLPVAASDDPAVARTPFELIEPGANAGAAGEAAAIAVGADELASRLALIRDRAQPRPILAPHRDARSEDLLVAVALLERVWQNDRGVTVEPMPAIAANAPATPAKPASERENR